ncbi:MAG: NAD(P)H-hydrate epimerase, partial [Deinococcales bacterium]
MARFLHAAGAEVDVLEMGSEPSGADAAAARRALLAHDVEPRKLRADTLQDALAGCDLVVDALLGSGLDRPLHGALQGIVEQVTASSLPVVAVDVPTGVSADTPTPPGPHLRADVTVQLAGAKRASAFYPARSAFGEAPVAD